MTRTAQHTPTRPPTRRDPRRPGTGSPRGQGGGMSRTTAGEALPGMPHGVGGSLLAAPGTDSTDLPPPAPGAAAPSATAERAGGRTVPGGGRPPAAAGRGAVSAALAPTPGHGSTAPATSTPVPARVAHRAATSAVPAQAAPGRVPQPRPTDLFADRLLAVLSGQRPVHWMLRHTAGRAYDELIRLAEHGPLRATRGTRPVVRDIGYYVPRPGAVEAFARIGAGDQVRAMAFRLERGADLRWRCTAVELDGSRAPHADDD
ncbi:Rv3235 family protein [Streptomyces sp. NPDC005492]|uniref:Rv3235 family protein n=1 Tax=Streptomyces sp. NPDC005492 TaxID=3156883 RepID=UPI0033A34ED4